ncbi:MAG: DUF4382 domain-containing protein [bacterium]
MIQRKKSVTVLLFGILGFLFVLMVVGISGCGTEEETESEYGDIVIGLTDNEGDFARYMVTVNSLTLTKANGAVVETLSVATEVDFAQYAEMTEFITAARIPSGTYTKATMTLDYRDADIQVYNDAGTAAEVDSIQDTDGDEITTCDISVRLENIGSLPIAAGIPCHLTLDFDLNASNNVEDDGNGGLILTVQPVLQAEVNADGSKTHRLRGPLKTVNTSTNKFNVIIRPFIHLLSGGDEQFGTLDVIVDEETIYYINEDSYEGNEGLAALDGQNTLTAIIVKGQLTINPRPARFEAYEVYAGSSVPGGTYDVVTGNVVNRSSTDITVKGATLIRSDGSILFNDTVTVQISENTRVRRQLSILNEYDKDDIFVGQRVRAFGTLTDDTAPDLVLDASSDGHIHMLITTLKGTVVDHDSLSQLVVNLDYIDGRVMSAFTFGAVNPSNYEIDTGSLSISDLTTDDPVKVSGFVMASGDASPDFQAHTIVDLSAISALMTVGWGLGSADAITGNVTGDSFSLNLQNVGLFHHVGRGGIVKDLNDFSLAPTIMPKSGGSGLFSINQSGTLQVFFTYESFTDNLQDRLDAGAVVKFLVAIGIFDDEDVTLSAGRVDINVE